MKNLKFNIFLLLLFCLFACDTQNIVEDQTPIEISNPQSSGDVDLVPVEDPDPSPDPDPDPTMYPIALSVSYQISTNRVYFRSVFQDLLNIQSITPCPYDDNIEVWMVDRVNERELAIIVESVEHLLGDIPVYPPSAGHLDAIDPLAERPGELRQAAFFFDRICVVIQSNILTDN